MALGSLPPWLNVSPSDYLRAAQSGAAMGHAIAESSLRAWEQQQRMQMAQAQQQTAKQQFQQEMGLRQAQLAATMQQRKAALEAATQYRMNQLGLGEGRLNQAQAALAERAQHNKEIEDMRQQSMEQRAEQQGALLDMRRQIDEERRNRTQDPVIPVLQEHAKKVQDRLLDSSISEKERYDLQGELMNTIAALRTPSKTKTPPNPYIVGKRYGNLRYKGGDPNIQNNWTPVTDAISTSQP